ncbi:unnamed protein product [Protopolystoma xenopodis]|uniref:Uncharacterized protein n=1 Tax=Protopolystoma xenopodis TaxID=117903 RepID=A0A448WSH9_9PLAT|nr:unnamed protein product [Protopolystoma xenopodis]
MRQFGQQKSSRERFPVDWISPQNTTRGCPLSVFSSFALQSKMRPKSRVEVSGEGGLLTSKYSILGRWMHPRMPLKVDQMCSSYALMFSSHKEPIRPAYNVAVNPFRLRSSLAEYVNLPWLNPEQVKPSHFLLVSKASRPAEQMRTWIAN